MDRAEKVLKFLQHLKHSKAPWAGQPFEPMPFQVDFIQKLYGTLREDGQRQYRQALLYLPRKNGKSFLASSLALYHLVADGKPGGEVYMAAGSRDQASICFNQARDFVRSSKTLSKRLRVIEYSKRIIDTKTGSVLKALAADGGLAHGLNPTAIIADELHVWEGKRGRELWEALQTGFGAREEPLLLIISTAGYDRASIFYEVYEHAKKVAADPSVDPTFLPVLYEAGPDDDWRTRQPGIKLTRHWGHSGHWTICRHWLTGQSRARRWRTVSGGCTLTSGLIQKQPGYLQTAGTLVAKLWTRRHYVAGSVTLAWTCPPQRTCRRSCWCFPVTTTRPIMMCCRSSGYQRPAQPAIDETLRTTEPGQERAH